MITSLATSQNLKNKIKITLIMASSKFKATTTQKIRKNVS
jgi:hypothetical protein